MIKAIIFDFDGVIIDSEKARYDAWQKVFSLYEKQLPIDEWIKNIGRAHYAADPFEILQKLTGFQLPCDDLQRRAKEYELEFVSNIPALPGVVRTIDEAEKLNITIAIASSSSRSWVEGHLRRLSIYDKFKTLVCREDTSEHKPSPVPYLTAVKRLGCLPEEALAIEDSPLGIHSAICAGLKCIAIGCSITKHLDLSKATLQLESLNDLDLLNAFAK